MTKLLTVGTSEHISYRVIFVVPGAVSFFAAFISRIGENRNFSIVQSLLCNPRGLISRVHGHELNIEFAGYIVIYLVPCHTVMDVSGSYLYSQNKTSFVTSRILKAVNGETDALDAVLRHYSSYICGQCTRPVKDTYGNEFLCVDESMRDQLEVKLRVSIVTAFKVLPV